MNTATGSISMHGIKAITTEDRELAVKTDCASPVQTYGPLGEDFPLKRFMRTGTVGTFKISNSRPLSQDASVGARRDVAA